MSKYRANRLIGMSADEVVCRRLALSYGIQPLLVPEGLAEGRAPWSDLETILTAKYSLNKGDLIVVVGDPAARHRASTLSIHVVGGGT